MIWITKEMINVKGGEYDRTALMNAAVEGHAKIVELLLNKGADVDVRSSLDLDGFPYPGWEAIHFATCNGHLDVAKLISKKHPKVFTAKTNDGETLLSLARRCNQINIINWLQKEKSVTE